VQTQAIPHTTTHNPQQGLHAPCRLGQSGLLPEAPGLRPRPGPADLAPLTGASPRCALRVGRRWRWRCLAPSRSRTPGLRRTAARLNSEALRLRRRVSSASAISCQLQSANNGDLSEKKPLAMPLARMHSLRIESRMLRRPLAPRARHSSRSVGARASEATRRPCNAVANEPRPTGYWHGLGRSRGIALRIVPPLHVFKAFTNVLFSFTN
jgi:hypothetical protein